MASGTDGTQVITGPVRTCVGCRKRQPASMLLRVVAASGTLVPDPRCRLPGRGAWLHPDEGCLDAAERRRAFGRAFRLAEVLDSSGVREFLRTGSAGAGHEPGTGPHPRGEARVVRKQVDPS